MIDLFITQPRLFELAFAQLGGTSAKKAGKITPLALYIEAEKVGLFLRDQWIQEQADLIFARLPLATLLSLEGEILEQVEQVDQIYYGDVLSGDFSSDEEIGQCLANAMAVLRWYKLVHAGKVDPLLYLSTEDAATWLDDQLRQIMQAPKPLVEPTKAGQLTLELV